MSREGEVSSEAGKPKWWILRTFVRFGKQKLPLLDQNLEEQGMQVQSRRENQPQIRQRHFVDVLVFGKSR